MIWIWVYDKNVKEIGNPLYMRVIIFIWSYNSFKPTQSIVNLYIGPEKAINFIQSQMWNFTFDAQKQPTVYFLYLLTFSRNWYTCVYLSNLIIKKGILFKQIHSEVSCKLIT